MDAVLAGGETEVNDVVSIISSGAVEHVKDTVIIDDSRVADHEVFPWMYWMRLQNRVVGMFLKFHGSFKCM
jgi:hypothetical protein